MPINPNIAMGYQPPQFADPLSQYGKVAAIQSAQNQNALAQLQMQQAQREQESTNALNAAYAAAYNPNTGAIDINKLRQTIATGGFGAKLPALEKGFAELEKQKLEQDKLKGEIAAQPLARSKAESELIDSKLKQSRSFLDTIDPADPNAPQQFLAWHQANHADPILGPALKARGITAEQSLARINQAVAAGPQAFAQLVAQSKLGTEKFMELNKPTTTVVDQSGQRQVIQVPGLGGKPTTVGTYADVPLPAEVEAQKARIAKSGASQTNVNVSTERKYGEQFAGKIADVDIGKMTAAEKAPELAANANRVLDILNKGNVFTGSAADIKLNVARALNLVGANNDESIANTEMLVSGLARNTLGAVKSSGLGAGQGFTDKDLKFLQDAEGGRITLNQGTLKQLAELSYKAAESSASAWNKRVKELPRSAAEGTGLSTSPIEIPKRPAVVPGRTGAPAVVRPAGVGANWTFERDAAGNTAWVSPDRKSFKEAK